MSSPPSFLKTRQVALALGVSVSTIKRWVDLGVLRASRTVGKHRMIGLSEALRFAKEQGLPLAGLEALVGIEPTALATIDDQARGSLLDALRQGRANEARTLIRSVYAKGRDGVELADRLIRPVMQRIGHGWMVGSLDVFQEHQATQILTASLRELVDMTTHSERPAPTSLALGAASEGDPYVLPGLLGELVLREGGWDVRNLGVNLPLTALANAVREYRPRLVFLTISHLENEERFISEYAAFFEIAVAGGVAVILGGRALTPEIRDRMIFASYGERMAHLAEFARRLVTATAGTTSDPSR